MLTIESLNALGANTQEGLGRCFGNEAFYLRLVGMGLNDAAFDRLTAAKEAGDLKGVFEASHALKGSIGNLSLTPLFEPLSRLTERTRNQEAGVEIDDLYEEIMDRLKEFRALL